ncbi:MAG: hypothetical protein A3E83_07295 [Gammaproteobacteria bacterium RIFCSPHIGHO2_12_FULL_41_20]|nr:MAG: hypothetical protein A3E83_07295 [Gammaproteobacteria bacterium RIFCSPHIGHO2_12_FULL_41_20]
MTDYSQKQREKVLKDSFYDVGAERRQALGFVGADLLLARFPISPAGAAKEIEAFIAGSTLEAEAKANQAYYTSSGLLSRLSLFGGQPNKATTVPVVAPEAEHKPRNK